LFFSEFFLKAGALTNGPARLSCYEVTTDAEKNAGKQSQAPMVMLLTKVTQEKVPLADKIFFQITVYLGYLTCSRQYCGSQIFISVPNPRIRNPELRIRIPGDQFITDPAGSGSYLYIFVVFGKKYIVK
jgi:hypothetical protein